MTVHGYELEHLDAAYPEIQADTLEETIVPGLTWLVSRYDRPVMIDDSGFFVDALKGFPGVFSSYVFKTIGCEGILRLMEGRSDRSARFECCIGFIAPGDEPFIAEGVAKGTVSHEMRGVTGAPSGECWAGAGIYLAVRSAAVAAEARERAVAAISLSEGFAIAISAMRRNIFSQ